MGGLIHFLVSSVRICYNVDMQKQLPATFRPLLWSLRWNDIDIEEDKDDIIVNTVNEGTLDQWRWIIEAYGKDTIRAILEKHLATEFHPESRNLARVVFSIQNFSHAR